MSRSKKKRLSVNKRVVKKSNTGKKIPKKKARQETAPNVFPDKPFIFCARCDDFTPHAMGDYDGETVFICEQCEEIITVEETEYYGCCFANLTVQ